MTAANLRVPVSSVTKHITMHVAVTGVRLWRVRLWLALHCLRLGAWIAGVGIQFNSDLAAVEPRDP